MNRHPYPAYKPSGVEWLGEVPESWTVERIKYVFWLQRGRDLPITDFLEGQYPVCGSNGIIGYHNDLTTKGPGVTVGRSGSVGEINFIESDFWAHENTALYIKEFRRADARYAFYLLKSLDVGYLSEGTAVGTLNRNYIHSLKMVFPDVHEQHAIVAFLDRETTRIDALVEKKQRQTELLQEKRTALISRAVTKGLNPNAKMKDSGVEWLGSVPEGWSISKLDFHASVKARLGWKGLKADEYVDEGFIFLSTPNIKNRHIDFDNVNYITKERYLESQEIMLEVGDVLIAKDGSTLGTTNVVRNLPAPATVNSSIAVLRPKPNLNSSFLYWIMVCHYTQSIIQQVKDGQGVPHLFQADLRQFWIWLPSYEEQRAIAAFLDREAARVDALIEKVKKSSALLREYRTSLISAAVTGKIDVRKEAT